GLEYNYQIIELLMSYLTSPYDKWYIDESKVIKPEYRNIGRNTICPCGSLKKYKNCCLNSEKKYTTHYRINLLFTPQNGVLDKEIIFTSTWK
ncbi:MAG: SEC-C domain-containing protein, partial [Oscillospiraceae bacterium]|nr:SEC-C domain-containing protein [Oscillospiraceae bacterium]